MDLTNAIQRFLSWKLPKDFAPDAYISFDKARAYANNCEPTGTNLLHAGQVRDMLEHIFVVQKLQEPILGHDHKPWPHTTDAKLWADEFCKRNTAADHDTMLGWFANAIEYAKDHGRALSLEPVKDQLSAQGQPGNWDYGPYMQGMYNGLECALATLEDREPVYRIKPVAGWLRDKESKPPTVGIAATQ